MGLNVRSVLIIQGACQTCAVEQAALDAWKATLSRIIIASCVPKKCLDAQIVTLTINAPTVATQSSWKLKQIILDVNALETKLK